MRLVACLSFRVCQVLIDQSHNPSISELGFDLETRKHRNFKSTSCPPSIFRICIVLKLITGKSSSLSIMQMNSSLQFSHPTRVGPQSYQFIDTFNYGISTNLLCKQSSIHHNSFYQLIYKI